MNKKFPDGVFPTMITPFTDKNKIDYESLEKLVEWYIQKGVVGLFAVCQSSEMFFLSLEERVKLATFVKKASRERVSVIASGHISDDFNDQVKEVNMISDTGVDAVVLVTNRFAGENESDDVWKKNLEKFLKQIPDTIALGFYECPYPYKRLITPDLLKFCADTKRFYFLKDTSCDVDNIKDKYNHVHTTGLKIFNANCATILETLQLGVAGFSGVMANFHPELYVWLCLNWEIEPEKAQKLQYFLSLASYAENRLYPLNAKYYVSLEGIPLRMISRANKSLSLSSADRIQLEHFRELSKGYSEEYCNKGR